MKTLYQKSIKDANREAKWGYVGGEGGCWFLFFLMCSNGLPQRFLYFIYKYKELREAA